MAVLLTGVASRVRILGGGADDRRFCGCGGVVGTKMDFSEGIV